MDFEELVKESVDQSIQFLKANGVRVQTSAKAEADGKIAQQFKSSFLPLDNMRSQSELIQAASQRFAFKIHPAQINRD